MAETQRTVSVTPSPSLREVPPPVGETTGLAAITLGKAERILQIGFAILAAVAGLDKFANQTTDWPQYLWPAIPRLFAITPQAFMYVVGVVEVVVAAGIALRPRWFADVLSLWLCGIALQLVAQGRFYDIALRDFALAAGACALARVSQARAKNF